MQRIILIIIGWLAVVSGTLGVVLPVLPMTPLILLATWCFARSSSCFHAWLLYRSWFGSYPRSQQKHHAMSRGAKPRAVSLILITFIISLWFAQMPWVHIMLLVIPVCLLSYMRRIPVIDEKQEKHRSTTTAVVIITYSQYILAFSGTDAGGQRLSSCYS